MENLDLKSLAQKLGEELAIERIYKIAGHPDTAKDKVLILVQSQPGVKFNNLRQVIATLGGSNIQYDLIQFGEVKNGLQQGNLFFHFTCLDANLLYKKDGGINFSAISPDKYLKWKKNLTEKYQNATSKVASFLDGANFYLDKGDGNLTVFMLHQVFELTFRALEIALLGKEKKTHDLLVHQQYVSSLFPQFELIFPNTDLAEKELLTTVNNAYTSVRYNLSHYTGDLNFPLLFERVKMLQDEANNIVEKIVSLLDWKNDNHQQLEGEITTPLIQIADYDNILSGKLIPHSSSLKRVVGIFIEYLMPNAIYLVNNTITHKIRSNVFDTDGDVDSTHIHYDLLIISSMPNPYSSSITTKLCEIEKVTLNFIVHSKDEVLRKVSAKNRFFEKVLKCSQLIAGAPVTDPEAICLSSETYYFKQTQFYTERRIARARALTQAAISIRSEEQETCVSLLAQSIEQASLALIFAYGGYVPNVHSLPHLIKVCSFFWPNKEGVFSIKSAKDQQVLTELSRSISELRFTVGKIISVEDFEYLYDKATSFIEKLLIVASVEIEHLQRVILDEKSLINAEQASVA